MGLVERFNRTLGNMLSLMVSARQRNWNEVRDWDWAYRSSRQETMGQTPNLFVRMIDMPVNVVYGRPVPEKPPECTTV